MSGNTQGPPLPHFKRNSRRQRPGYKHMIPAPVRTIFVIVFGEFCGTFMFLLLSYIGAQTAIVNNVIVGDQPNAPLAPYSLMYIAASFGTALAINVWIFYRITGGMFNPAVCRFSLDELTRQLTSCSQLGHVGTSSCWCS